MDFSALILDSLSQSETCQASIEQRDGFLEENPLEFMINLVVTPQQVQDNSYFNACMTILYSITLHKEYLLNPEIIIPFWGTFGDAIQTFLRQDCEESTKFLIGNIIAQIVNSLRKLDSENFQIQEYLLTLLQSDGVFIPYIIHAISMILYQAPDFGGFSPETLISLLDVEVCPNQVISLYFAIATKYDDSGDIHEKFEYILELVNNDEEGKVNNLRTIENFAEMNAIFFLPHIELFAKYIKELMIQSPNPDIKNFCIFIFQALIENSPEVYSTNQFYYESMFDAFVIVMSQINEDSSYDPIDDEPSSVSRIAFGTISSYIKNTSAIQYFLSIPKGFLASEEENGYEYGILIAYSSVEGQLFLLDLFRDFNTILEIAVSEVPPRIKYAAFEALNNITMKIIEHNPEHFLTVLSSLFETLSNIEVTEVSISCARFIKKYISNISNSNIEVILGDVYECLKTFIVQCKNEELISILIKCIKKLFRPVEVSQEIFQDLCEFLNEIVKGIDSDITQCAALNTFSVLFDNEYRSGIEGIDSLIEEYFQLGLRLQTSSSLTPSQIWTVKKSLMKLIGFLGESFNSYSDDMISTIFETISVLPSVDECEVTESVSSTAYYCIPNSPQGKTKFIDNSLLREYEECYQTLTTIVENIGTDFAPNLQNFLEASLQIMHMDEHIDPLKCYIFPFFSTTLRVFESDPSVLSSLFEIMCSEVINQMNYEWSIKGYSILTNFVRIIIQIYNETKEVVEYNDEQITQFLPFIKIVTFKFFELFKDETVPTTMNLELKFVISLLKEVEKLFPEETIAFFKENINEGIIANTENLLFAESSFSMLASFISIAGSEEIFMEYKDFIISYITKEPEEDSVEAIEAAVTVFLKYFKKNKLSESLAHEMFAFLMEFINGEQINSEDDMYRDLYDTTLVSIVYILFNNGEYFSIAEYDACLDLMPLNNNNIYQFIVARFNVYYIGRFFGTEEFEESTVDPEEIFAEISLLFDFIDFDEQCEVIAAEMNTYFFQKPDLLLCFQNFLNPNVCGKYDKLSIDGLNEFVNYIKKCPSQIKFD